jgi:hypothetical protein
MVWRARGAHVPHLARAHTATTVATTDATPTNPVTAQPASPDTVPGGAALTADASTPTRRAPVDNWMSNSPRNPVLVTFPRCPTLDRTDQFDPVTR